MPEDTRTDAQKLTDEVNRIMGTNSRLDSSRPIGPMNLSGNEGERQAKG